MFERRQAGAKMKKTLEKTANLLPSTNAIAADMKNNTEVTAARRPGPWLALIDEWALFRKLETSLGDCSGRSDGTGFCKIRWITFRKPLGDLVSRQIKIGGTHDGNARPRRTDNTF